MPNKKTAPAQAGAASETQPLLQWAVAGLGVIITFAVVAIIVWEAAQPDSPADLHAELEGVERTAHGYVARIKVINAGLETAAAVDIEGATATEQASASIAYVPGHGDAVAFLRFASDPRTAVFEVKGWSEP